jgi:Fe2+ transport system protein FeoA
MEIRLDQLKPASSGRIKGIDDNAGILKKRLLDMGLVKGALVEVIRIAPLGDPIDIKVKGYNLSLRKEEAAQVMLE